MLRVRAARQSTELDTVLACGRVSVPAAYSKGVDEAQIAGPAPVHHILMGQKGR